MTHLIMQLLAIVGGIKFLFERVSKQRSIESVDDLVI